MAKRRRRSKKWIWWTLFLILLVIAGVVCYLVWDNYFNDKKGDSDIGFVEVTEPEELNENNIEIIENVVDDSEDGERNDEKKVAQYEGEDPNKAEGLSGAVTYAGVFSEKLMIRVNIDQYLQSGNCQLILKKDGVDIYGDVANITGSASTATCEGFDVPVSGLSAGNYSIEIILKSDEKSGVIRGEVDI